MQSINRRLSYLFVLCAIAAILCVTLFVNVTVTSKFNQYMMDIQKKRYDRIVEYLEEAYKREGKWTSNTGIELLHEAYMSNYCLTLLDQNKKFIWGMNPEDIQSKAHLTTMITNDNGVYSSKTFPIKFEGETVGFIDIGQYSSVLLTEEDVNFKTSINKSIMVSGLVSLIIIIGLSLYFSKQFTLPIKDVSRMSVDLSKGNFETKSDIKSNVKELVDLQKSVNVLAEKLKYQDLLRQQLVTDISHEIRTPLNVLQNNLEAMIDGIFPVTTEKLSSLNEEVIRFGKLINSLNVLKEFESESTKLAYEDIYLDEFILEISKDFTIEAEQKEIKIHFEVQPNHKYLIAGDKDKLKQVFINLISNAIKFTNRLGEVSIRLFEDHNHVWVEIQDTGIGISEEDLPHIFERLYRGDKSRNKVQGNGLGLTIVKNLLQLHDATIQVKSKENVGTIFTLSFVKNNKALVTLL